MSHRSDSELRDENRGNISNALTDNMMADLNINQEVVNTGNSLVFVGIVIGDIPANLAIQKVGSLFNNMCRP